MPGGNTEASSPASLHASAVVVGEAGILIRGRSGAGKSSLAFSLLQLAHQAGRFARLVGDDRVELHLSHGRLVAQGHPHISGLIEMRGQGILHLPHERAVVLRLVVDLLPAAESMRFPGEGADVIELCGAKLPRLALQSERSSYDCAQLVLAYLRQDETI